MKLNMKVIDGVPVTGIPCISRTALRLSLQCSIAVENCNVVDILTDSLNFQLVCIQICQSGDFFGDFREKKKARKKK